MVSDGVRSDIAVNVATNRPRRHPMSMRRSIGEDWLREIDIFDVTSIASLDDASGDLRFFLLCFPMFLLGGFLKVHFPTYPICYLMTPAAGRYTVGNANMCS